MNKETNFDKRGKFKKGNSVQRQRLNPGRRRKVHRFIEEAEKLLFEDRAIGNAIALTDNDIRVLVNSKIDKGDRICEGRFSEWKRGYYNDESERQLGESFRDMYFKALADQKRALFSALSDKGESRSWGRWAWVLERKFDEWNLRTRSIDETVEPKVLVLKVE